MAMKKKAAKKAAPRKKAAARKKPVAKKKAASRGTVVAATGIKREKGFLYFLDKAGNVRKTKMKRGGTRGAKRCKH